MLKLKSELIPQNLSELEHTLLELRGIKAGTKEAEKFFKVPKIDKLKNKDIELNKSQLETAVKRIVEAINNKESIVIFGDYDADGVCATTILWKSITSLGGLAKPFVPEREKHGYGITPLALKEVIENHQPKLVITVDNGIVAHEAVEFLNTQKIDCIITDHHEPEISLENGKELMPNALAVVHSTKLCGTTVAYFVAKELESHFDSEQVTKEDQSALKEKSEIEKLALCGIATIADQVKLLGANRSFAYYGLKALQKTTNIGLLALFKLSGIKQEEINEVTVGFMIAPRINAMGRIDTPLSALRLLCTSNSQTVNSLAQKVCATNTKRQNITTDYLETAKAEIALQVNEHLNIVASSEFHEGVIGLIAGHITQMTNKPSIVIALKDEIGKASARSVYGVDIVSLLREFKSEFLAVGGHKMAAGFSFKIEKFDEIKNKIFALAKEKIAIELLSNQVVADLELSKSLVSLETYNFLQKFAPFGQGNEAPAFYFKNYKILTIKQLGKDQNHLKITCLDSQNLNSNQLTLLGWKMGDVASNFTVGQEINFVGSLSINNWQNKTYLQVEVSAIF